MKQPQVGDIGVIQSWPIIVTKSDPKRFSYDFIGLGPANTAKKATNGRFLALHSEDKIPKEFFKGTPFAGNINKALKIAKDILKEKSAKWGSEIGRKRDSSEKLIRSENAIKAIDHQKRIPRISNKKKKSSAKSKKTAKSKSSQRNKQQVGDLNPNSEVVAKAAEDNIPVEENDKAPVEAEIITDDQEAQSSIEGNEKKEVDVRKICERAGKAPKIDAIAEKDNGTTSGEANAQEQVEISGNDEIPKEEAPNNEPEVERMDVGEEKDQSVKPQEDADDSVEEERVIQEASTSNSSWRDFFGRARFW